MDNKTKIEAILKINPGGLSIHEIAKLTKLTVTTITKYIAFFEGSNQLSIRYIGNSKLIYWKEAVNGEKI